MSKPYAVEKTQIGDEIVPFYYFDNPMFHEDWHEAEGLGLVYLRYCHYGPDYWDDKLLLVPKNKKEFVQKHEAENHTYLV